MYKEREENTRIPLVVTYNKRLPKLKPILEDSWKILAINDTERQKFTEKPLISYRRNKNLRDMIGQTRISQNKVVKGVPCRSPAGVAPTPNAAIV